MSWIARLGLLMHGVAVDVRSAAALVERQSRELAIAAARARVELAFTARVQLADQIVGGFEQAEKRCTEAVVALLEAATAADRYAYWLHPDGVGSDARTYAPPVISPDSLIGVSPATLYEGEYLGLTEAETGALSQLIDAYGRHRPERYVAAINPYYATELKAVDENCMYCAMAFADLYQGLSREPAPAVLSCNAVEPDRLWDWAGVDPELYIFPDDGDNAWLTGQMYEHIEARLDGLPGGTAAIVAAGLEAEKGWSHFFNAYIDDGGVLHWADAQTGEVGDWPPPYEDNFIDFCCIYRVPGGVWQDAG